MENIKFSSDEVLRLAINIEENGKRFYKEMADREKNEKIRSLLLVLVQEEIKHKEIFEEILSRLKNKEIVETTQEEYSTYISALSRECILTEEVVEEKIKEGFKSPERLLDFALNLEKNSIIFYTHIKENIFKDIDEIEKILHEERKHFVMISEMKKQI